MLTLLKKLSGALGDGMWRSGRPVLESLDLDRHFALVEELLAQEEWPFVRGDLEVSQAQPWATSRVAWKDGRFAGFFATHHFGTVGYLDMMIIAPGSRRGGIARPLYFATVRALREKGVRSLVVHTTNDSARLIRLLGFRPGMCFVLLRRAAAGPAAPLPAGVRVLGAGDREAIVALDALVFGAPRGPWFDALLADPGTRFFGLERDGVLRASLAVRDRRGGAAALDSANADGEDDLASLVDAVLAAEGRSLECFVREGSPLQRRLAARGFTVPEFFQSIGPLVEWRKGATGGLGRSDRVQTLNWF